MPPTPALRAIRDENAASCSSQHSGTARRGRDKDDWDGSCPANIERRPFGRRRAGNIFADVYQINVGALSKAHSSLTRFQAEPRDEFAVEGGKQKNRIPQARSCNAEHQKEVTNHRHQCYNASHRDREP